MGRRVTTGLSWVDRASLRQHLGRIEPEYKEYTSYKGDCHLNCKINDARSH